MNRRKTALFVAGLGAWFAAREARAQSACAEVEVTREIDVARADRLAERFLPAYDRLNALLRRCPSPRVRAQLALAEQSLRRWPDAYGHLREALAATNDPWISDPTRHAALEGALREISAHLPQLAPSTNVPGAELSVDGARVGALPLATPHVIPTGSATIELRAPGHRTLRRVVSVPNETVFREMLTLEPEASTPPAGQARTPPTPEPGTTPPPLPPSSPGPNRTQRILGWVSVGVGAVLGGLGVWQVWEWSALASESAEAKLGGTNSLAAWARFDRAVNDGSLTSAQVCDLAQSNTTSSDAAGTRELCSQSATHSALALGLGLGGAALVVTGAVLVATSGRSTAEHRAFNVGPWIGASARGATLQVEF